MMLNVMFSALNANEDILDQLLIAGWTSVSWEGTCSLQDVATQIFLKKSANAIYKLGITKTLTAINRTVATAGTKSALRGLDGFPPHTDEAYRPVPPRFLLLRSISGATESTTDIYPFLADKISESLLSGLSSGLWAWRGFRIPHICAVWENDRLKWDEDCMRPLDQLAKRAHSEFQMFIMSAPKVSYTWSNRLSVLLIDNWKTMHARGPVPVDERREIERLYVEIA